MRTAILVLVTVGMYGLFVTACRWLNNRRRPTTLDESLLASLLKAGSQAEQKSEPWNL